MTEAGTPSENAPAEDPSAEDAAAGLFVAAFYRATRPDLQGGADLDLLRHYVAHGWREGSHPHPLFDPAFYLWQRPDLVLSGVEPLGHYARQGWRDGVQPHPLFDLDSYRQRYPDLADQDPLTHYEAVGWREGASPHPLFDPAFYRSQLPDIPAGMDPFLHYRLEGWRQGVKPHPLFDPAFYLSQRPDLAAAGLEPLAHYVQHGWREGAQPHPYFDVVHYRAQAGEPTTPDLQHYLQDGEPNGLRPNTVFSPIFYRVMHGAVMGDIRSALKHYVRFGEQQGLPTSPEFRGRRYASRYLSYEADRRPMRHFMLHGLREGAAIPAPLVPPFTGQVSASRNAGAEVGSETGPEVTLLLLGPADAEARADQLAEVAALPRGAADGTPRRCAVGWVAELDGAADLASWAESLQAAPASISAGRPVLMLAGAVFMARSDLLRLGAAAVREVAHPMVLDRSGDVFHAGFEPEGRIAAPRGRGADPAHPGLSYMRRDLLTSGPVLGAPAKKLVAAARSLGPDGSLADLFLSLSAGSRYTPDAYAYQLDAVVGGPGAAATNLPATWPRRTRAVRRRMLFIDSILPRAGFDAGSHYALQLMNMFQEFGYDVTLAPDAELAGDPALVRPIADRGIQVIQAPFARDTAAYIAGSGENFDVVIMSRFNCGGRHMEALRTKWPAARLVFHPGDLHHIREMREALHKEDAELFRSALLTKRREFEIAASADATVVVSQYELDVLRNAGVGERALRIDPEYTNRAPAPYEAATRHGIAFIGGYGHLPNVDAVVFLCEKIWPIVSATRPGIKLLIVGSNPPLSFGAYASESVVIRGLVPDLDGLLDTLRFTIAPLRYGAGVKMKLVTSLAAGVPALCSAIAAEGIGLAPGEGYVLAEGAESFAQAVIDLYDDAARLSALSTAGYDAVVKRFSAGAVRESYRTSVGVPTAGPLRAQAPSRAQASVGRDRERVQ